MKKYLLVILLSLAWTSTFAQTISYRNDSSAGTNYLITDFIRKYDTGVSLQIITSQQSGEKKCILGIYSEGKGRTYCQDNSRAVLKTFSGNIITLVQRNNNNENEIIHLGDSQSTIWALKVHYDISEEELNLLMNEGIAILRVETLAGIREYNYDKDYLGKFLRSELDLINDKKSFENDF